MIEVNLLPGGKKGAKGGGGGGFSLKSLKLPQFNFGAGGVAKDPYTLFFAAAAAIAIGFIGYTFMSSGNEREELDVRLEQERQDSIRFAALIEQTNQLTARRDLLAQRVAVIQSIDANRYVWSHALDEIGSAIPDYLWLREVMYAGENPLVIRLAGRAGSIFAITNFLRRLEASRFLRDAQIQMSQAQPSEANPEEMVQVFELTVAYEPPPLDELETVPLFEGGVPPSGN